MGGSPRRVGAAICERRTLGMRAFAGAGGLLGGELFLPRGAPRGGFSGARVLAGVVL